MPPPDLPAQLDAAFGTDKHFHGLYELAKRDAHPDQYRRFMDFEAEAEVIENFEPLVVPGLLQTREYADAQLGQQEPQPPRTRARRPSGRLGHVRQLSEGVEQNKGRAGSRT
ncbi:Scr1 family TA system antitoxin-like transcriptional regulator [Streptomyces sp. B21-083]|uniref:Scr1 family TA system antitoxin-like transcriptional regulator n=1 Tax=Streptomyces sp. B21-083 TaxID=3039410 RepID=UPI002FF2DE94